MTIFTMTVLLRNEQRSTVECIGFRSDESSVHFTGLAGQTVLSVPRLLVRAIKWHPGL